MGRKRRRPVRGPLDGVARGAVQRAVLTELLTGGRVGVPVTRETQGVRPPAGMSKRAWGAFSLRLAEAGYRLICQPDDYAGGLFDTYRIVQLLPDEERYALV